MEERQVSLEDFHNQDYSASEILYMLRDLPDACCIFKVITDPFGTVKDMQFLFANEKYASILGIPVGELVGARYYEMNSNRDEDWIRLSYQAAILRQSSINRTFNTRFRKWFEFWVVPVYQKGYCAYIIHDVTAQTKIERSREQDRKSNNIIIECAKIMSAHDFKKGIKQVLKRLGTEIKADRVYVVESNNGEVGEFYEWTHKNTGMGLPAKKYFEKFDFFTMWGKQLKGEDLVVVDDVRPISELNGEVYNEVLAGTISRYIIATLRERNEIIGYLIADNYSSELDIKLREVFKTVAIFIGAELHNYNLTKKMTYLSNHDVLTGLGNRYSNISNIHMLEGMQVPVGICYADINGLKKVNDNEGHEAGDELLKNAADILASVFKAKYCYRVGGDEFIAMIPQIEEEKFNELIAKLNEKLEKKNAKVCMAVGSKWISKAENIEKAIHEADTMMYKDKAAYYNIKK